ncbi:MAG TPA: BTAD domain-containing putative transcriptional regulator [Gaiellaceae bacterium]|nr:BTAD domain-containing putative transcriptional regulator [Gaiellaceae bacterium]
MEFRILGPLEVVEDGNPVALGTLKERLVLGVLLLHANEFVSRDRLIDDLWGEAPPPTARKAVNVYLSQVRKSLAGAGADPITTAPGGYRLDVEPEQLDAARVQLLVGSARECVAKGELESAAGRFQEALSLWRGPTLAGLELESRGRDEVAALDELRLTALMDRIDCDLALGRHEHALGELRVLVAEHPLRERLRAQQMLALYRADRQAEALEAYAAARTTLVDDLGIEPSEALQRLQQAILRHDPSLESPEGTAAVNGGPPAESTPALDAERVGDGRPGRFRPRRWQLAVAGLVVLAGSAAAAATLATSSARATPLVVPNSLVRLDPRTGKPNLVVPVGIEPGPIAITPTAIWTANYGSDDVSRYDLRTHKVETRGVTPGQPYDIVFDRRGNAWVANTPANDEPTRRSVVVRLAAGPGGTSAGPLAPSHIRSVSFPLHMAGYEALGAGYLWVIVGGHGPLPGDDRVALVDLGTSEVKVLHLHNSATSIAFGYGSAWIGTYSSGGNSRLEAIRAGASKPAKVALLNDVDWGPESIAVGEGAVWTIANRAAGAGQRPELFEIDPQTLQVVNRLDLTAEQHGAVAVGAGAVWTTGGIGGGNTTLANSVTEIDPRTERIIRSFPLGSRTRVTCGIAATASAVWVAIGNTSCDTIGQ